VKATMIDGVSGHSGKAPRLPKENKKAVVTNRDSTDHYAPPTGPERTVQAAHDEKVHATRKWVSGEISNAEHSKIHARADHVIKKKGKM
jgi:hypothetical protein